MRPNCLEKVILYLFSINWIKISSSSSSSHRISTDLPDPLLPPTSIAHRFWLVFKATSCIGTELLYVSPIWTLCLCSFM